MKPIPKIIHLIWIGGGNLAQVKSLEGIHSWLENEKDYQIWIWWDDAHMLTIPARSAMGGVGAPEKRSLYERDLKLGRDIHNLRYLTAGKDADAKLEQTRTLIEQMQHNFECLRQIAKDNPGRVKLCNIRKHEYLPGAPGSTMKWKNRELFDVELSRRGIFPAAASDILRYEVLYNYGGIYMDVDFASKTNNALGNLSVQDDLALCGFISSSKRRRDERALTDYQRATSETHKNECFYAVNALIATHPGSRFVDILRDSIAIAYRRMGVGKSRPVVVEDDGKLLKKYWEEKINKATIDLTGPNLVRDIQYCIFRDFDRERIAHIMVDRLLWELAAHPDKEHWGVDDHADMATIAYPRNAELWRDDDPFYQPFFEWVWKYTWFPMQHIVWETDASKKSDTKAAKFQALV